MATDKPTPASGHTLPTNAEIKKYAARMAAELAEVHRIAARTAFQTFLLNPSPAVFGDAVEKMEAYAYARKSQATVAEWPDDNGPFIS